MGRMMTVLTVQANRRRDTFGALIDSGSGVTILSNAAARLLGIRTSAREYLEIGGQRHAVCYRTVDLHIPGTNCFVEHMPVAVICNREEDVFSVIIGADFLQRTGAFLDFRKGKHAVGGDVRGRDASPASFDRPKRVRLRNGH